MMVMEWLPNDRLEVLSAAIPDPLREDVPSEVAPSMNVTVPLGMPDPGELAVTVAVNVTDWPDADGLIDDDTALLVESWFTV